MTFGTWETSKRDSVLVSRLVLNASKRLKGVIGAGRRTDTLICGQAVPLLSVRWDEDGRRAFNAGPITSLPNLWPFARRALRRRHVSAGQRDIEPVQCLDARLSVP